MYALPDAPMNDSGFFEQLFDMKSGSAMMGKRSKQGKKCTIMKGNTMMQGTIIRNPKPINLQFDTSDEFEIDNEEVCIYWKVARVGQIMASTVTHPPESPGGNGYVRVSVDDGPSSGQFLQSRNSSLCSFL